MGFSYSSGNHKRGKGQGRVTQHPRWTIHDGARLRQAKTTAVQPTPSTRQIVVCKTYAFDVPNGEVLTKAQADRLLDTGKLEFARWAKNGGKVYHERQISLDSLRRHRGDLARLRQVMGSEHWTYYSTRLATVDRTIATRERQAEQAA